MYIFTINSQGPIYSPSRSPSSSSDCSCQVRCHGYSPAPWFCSTTPVEHPVLRIRPFCLSEAVSVGPLLLGNVPSTPSQQDYHCKYHPSMLRGDKPQTQWTEKEAECLSHFLIQRRRLCGDPHACLSPQRIQGVTIPKLNTTHHQCPAHWDEKDSDCALVLFVK